MGTKVGPGSYSQIKSSVRWRQAEQSRFARHRTPQTTMDSALDSQITDTIT